MTNEKSMDRYYGIIKAITDTTGQNPCAPIAQVENHTRPDTNKGQLTELEGVGWVQGQHAPKIAKALGSAETTET